MVIILAGTYTGHYEPVKEMADLLDEYETKTGHSVPIHGLCVRVPLLELLRWQFSRRCLWRIRGPFRNGLYYSPVPRRTRLTYLQLAQTGMGL